MVHHTHVRGLARFVDVECGRLLHDLPASFGIFKHRAHAGRHG
jgi:hypothetical protein